MRLHQLLQGHACALCRLGLQLTIALMCVCSAAAPQCAAPSQSVCSSICSPSTSGCLRALKPRAATGPVGSRLHGSTQCCKAQNITIGKAFAPTSVHLCIEGRRLRRGSATMSIDRWLMRRPDSSRVLLCIAQCTGHALWVYTE